MLSYEETLDLIKKAQNKDKKAQEILINSNYQLVKSIVNKYKFNQIDYDILLQLGNLGLFKAIMKFDINYNVKFSTYAVPMIAGEIKRYLRDNGLIKVPRSVKILCSNIQKFINIQLSINGVKPSVDEIANKFNIEASEVAYVLDSSKRPIYLYEKIDDDSSCVIDKLSEEEEEIDLYTKVRLKEYIKELPIKEKKVILLRFYRDLTQSEIASMLGISQVQVSRIEKKVIENLREKFKNNN